ncbi:ABC transporter ATP-binding protein [Streptomyces sp. SID8352]|uniref:ABC transporter ATP-binding protein n=1 Tax=Streptomyces sp. SID8352 TaxID=2690338 RepID=UPI00136C6DD5|nr:ABC transporter ATP-binding protein [Streptomyces sp. SID8352]MYU25233.1 ATP-binding cassette domain-containing protein [Streptomyces sp. SID8352]
MTPEHASHSPSVGRSPLARALLPSLPLLGVASFTAAVAGLCGLGALWSTTRLLTDPTPAYAVWACAAWITSGLLSAVSSWTAHRGEARFAERVRREVAGHLARMPMSALAGRGGDALRRLVSDDIAALHHAVAHLPAESTTLAVVPVASVLVLLAVAGPSALLALVPGLLAACYYLLVVPRTSARHGAESARVMSDVVTAVDDYARGILVCRAYGAQTGAAARYAAATRRFTTGMVRWVGRVATLAAVAGALLQAAATYAIAYAVGHAQDAGTLAAMLLFGLAVVTPALRLGHGLDYVRAGRAAADRIAEVFQEPLVTLSSHRAGQGENATGMALAGLTVGSAERVLVHEVTHAFKPSTITVVTGPSGSGKTTLLRVIAGLESATAGDIVFPPAPAARSRAHASSGPVLLVPQGGDVLPGAVRDTLRLSAPDHDDRDLAEGLRRAQLGIPPETETTNLSGGERQRVGLARVFLTDAPVILLDEPTSALDEHTAARFMAELRLLADSGRTLIIVTHDLQLAATADAQLTLADGRLTTTGAIR